MDKKVIKFWELVRISVIEFSGFPNESKRGEMKIRFNLSGKESRKLRKFLRSEVHSIRPKEDDKSLLDLLKKSLLSKNYNYVWQRIRRRQYPSTDFLISEEELYSQSNLHEDPSILCTSANFQFFILILTTKVSSKDLEEAFSEVGRLFVDRMTDYGLLWEKDGVLEVDKEILRKLLPRVSKYFDQEIEEDFD